MLRDVTMTSGIDHFFSTLIFEDKAVIRTFPVVMYNNRAIWAEVELSIFFKLRFGLHPCEIDFWIYQGLQETSGQNSYPNEFFHGCFRMMENLRWAGLFHELPHRSRYRAIADDDVKKARFISMMYHRFEDEYEFHSSALDENLVEAIDESPELDDESVEKLNKKYRGLSELLESKYSATKGVLLKSERDMAHLIPAFFDANDTSKEDMWNGRGSYPGVRGYSVPVLDSWTMTGSASSRLKTGGIRVDRTGSPEPYTPTNKNKRPLPAEPLTTEPKNKPEQSAAKKYEVSNVLGAIDTPNGTHSPGVRGAKYWKAKKLEMFVLPTTKAGGRQVAELAERGGVGCIDRPV